MVHVLQVCGLERKIIFHNNSNFNEVCSLGSN